MRNISLTRIVVAHALFQIPGLLALAHFVAEQSRRTWERSHYIDNLAAWAIQPQPPKIESILEYALLLALGAVLILVVAAYSRRDRGYVRMGGWQWAALGAYELACLITPDQSGMPIGWLVLAILLPMWLFSCNRKSPTVVAQRTYLAIAAGALGSALWLLAATSWSPELRFINDYADFPEYTRLQDGRLVENAEFLRANNIPGWSKASSCEEKDATALNVCLPLSKAVFRDAYESFLLFPPGSGLAYSWDKEILLAYRPLGEKEKLLIQSLWGVKPDLLEKDKLRSKTYWRGPKEKASGAESVLPQENYRVKEFLQKNNNELEAQRQLGRFFYHHAYLYLPALERVLFPGDHITPAQYGEGLTSTLGTLIKSFGAPTFQAYYSFFWWGLYAYLVLLGFVTWWITRDAWASVLATGAAMSLVLVISYDALRMAPGFNPIRHFPDLLCLLAIAHDLRRRSRLSALLRAAAIGILIWWNREFGLFFLGASMAWLIAEACSATGRWRRPVAQFALEAVFAVVLLISANSGGISDLAQYNLLGIGAPLTRWRDVFGWLAIWTPLIAGLIWIRFFREQVAVSERQNNLLDIAGIGAVYAALATIYALWNPSPNHAAVIWMCAVIPLTAFFLWIVELASRDKVLSHYFLKYSAVISFFILAFMIVGNQTVLRQFEEIFDNHQVMRWTFPGLTGSSTADPKVMQESVALIEKYQPKGRILLISRYDSLLQILTNRLPLLPYVELPGAVVSREMVEKIAARVLQSNAQFLYADKDLLDEREWQIPYDNEGEPDSGAANRVASLAALGQVFHRIAHCYTPGEAQGALRVWHRTCEAQKI